MLDFQDDDCLALEDFQPANPFFDVNKDMSGKQLADWGADCITYFKRGRIAGKEVWFVHARGQKIGVTANIDVAKEMVRRCNMYTMMVQ
ncbi:MAG: hypothetical protein FWF01_04720 [Alphaproteobacteria bacterium]|nr:hypothetical protein [Alphaproteobacteria bacterium]